MFLLFDIGGTKTRIAVSRDKKTIKKEDVEIFPTPHSFDEGIGLICQKAQELSDKKEIEAGAGGIGGPLNSTKEGIVSNSNKPSLKDWVGKSFQTALEKSLGSKIKLENDSALGALGEAKHGAGKDHSIIAFLTIGTGVGGARIVNGEIDESVFGFEPGKQIVDADGTIFPEDDPPTTLEEVVGGQFIEKRMGKMPSEIEDEEFWEKVAHFLAIGLNDTIVHWSPDIVVIGGSLSNDIPLEKTERILKTMLHDLEKIPQVKKAELGDLSGLYGALELLKNQGK